MQLQLSFPLARCTCVISTEGSHGSGGLKIESMGLPSDDAEVLFSLLPDCAHAPSPTALDLPVDHHYQQHVDNLKTGQHNQQVQEWLETKWLSSPKVKDCYKKVIR